MRAYRIALIMTLAVLLAASAFGSSNVMYKDIRALGMGGPGIATMNDFSALMYNPAQLVRAEFHIDLINLQAYVGKDVTDMFTFYDDNQETFDDFDAADAAAQQKLLDDMTPFDDNWMGFGAYPQIGVSLPNYAVGIYGAANINFKGDKGIVNPKVYMRGVADYVLSGGMAIELPVSFVPNKLYGGAAIKIIRRYQVEDLKLDAKNVGAGDSFDTLVEKSLNGFGLDIGLLYEFIPGKMDVGLKVTDLIGSIDGDAPPRLVNIGAAYHVSPDFLLAADFNDMFFTEGENIFNKLFFGGEYTGLGILALRGGFSQGYPSFGAGLNLGFLNLDGAMYGVEHTDRPGGDGDYQYAVRLKLGF